MISMKNSNKKVMQNFDRIRYMLARPLQVRIVPAFVPIIPLPWVKQIPYITVGQILLMAPWLILFFAGYHTTFTSPGLDSSGNIASYAIIAAFLTANKANSFLSFFFGLSFERIVPIHNLYACLSVILSVFHGYVAYVYGGSANSGDASEGSSDRRLSGDESNFALYGSNTNLWKFLWDGDTNFTGSMCTACLVGLVTLSFFRVIRKYLFEPWLFSHILFSVGVIVFGIMHSVPILILPFAWWALDLFLRYVLQACGRFPTSATLTKLSDDVVEVRFLRTFHFEPGQFVQISIPSLGPLQFHPFTISSAPFEKEATLHVRSLGGWTQALVNLADRASETSMLVEGPFGKLSLGVFHGKTYPVVLCIAGGIGVTPCESVARQLLNEAESSGKLAHLRFVWIVRKAETIDHIPTVVTSKANTLDAESGEDTEVSSDKALRFQPEVYVTGARDSDLSGRENAFKGRPDIPQIIRQTVAAAKTAGVGRVAVITCGPGRMVDDVKKACRQATGTCGAVALDVHDEVFEF